MNFRGLNKLNLSTKMNVDHQKSSKQIIILFSLDIQPSNYESNMIWRGPDSGILSNIKSQALCEKIYSHYCRPASLIFYNKARKLGYTLQIFVSYLHHYILLNHVLNFCVEISNKKYDPALQMRLNSCDASAK